MEIKWQTLQSDLESLAVSMSKISCHKVQHSEGQLRILQTKSGCSSYWFFQFLGSISNSELSLLQCHTPRCLTKYNRRSQGLLGFQMEDAIFIPSGFTTSPGPFSTTVSQQRLPQLPNYPKRIPPPPTWSRGGTFIWWLRYQVPNLKLKAGFHID